MVYPALPVDAVVSPALATKLNVGPGPGVAPLFSVSEDTEIVMGYPAVAGFCANVTTKIVPPVATAPAVQSAVFAVCPPWPHDTAGVAALKIAELAVMVYLPAIARVVCGTILKLMVAGSTDFSSVPIVAPMKSAVVAAG